MGIYFFKKEAYFFDSYVMETHVSPKLGLFSTLSRHKRDFTEEENAKKQTLGQLKQTSDLTAVLF